MNLKQTIQEINGFPIGRRLLGYFILLICGSLFLFGVAFALVMVWGLLNAEPPHFDPDTTEWGLR